METPARTCAAPIDLNFYSAHFYGLSLRLAGEDNEVFVLVCKWHEDADHNGPAAYLAARGDDSEFAGLLFDTVHGPIVDQEVWYDVEELELEEWLGLEPGEGASWTAVEIKSVLEPGTSGINFDLIKHSLQDLLTIGNIELPMTFSVDTYEDEDALLHAMVKHAAP